MHSQQAAKAYEALPALAAEFENDDAVADPEADPEAVNYDLPTIDETQTVNGWGRKPVAVVDDNEADQEPSTDDLTHDIGNPVGHLEPAGVAVGGPAFHGSQP